MEKDYSIINKFGYCYYTLEEGYYHIYNLYVYPNFRKRGKAREILQIVIDKIRENGYSGEIRIVANPNEHSIELDKLVEF